MQPTLDPSSLAAWRAQTRDIDPTFVSELILEVLTDTAMQITALEHASTVRDTAKCTFVAHRLKSSCHAVGAFRLASLFEGMEVLAKSGAVRFLPELVTEIRAEYGRLEPALQQERCA